VTPKPGSRSRMALLLTSSSLARSLIRTLSIRPVFLRISAKSSSEPPGSCAAPWVGQLTRCFGALSSAATCAGCYCLAGRASRLRAFRSPLLDFLLLTSEGHGFSRAVTLPKIPRGFSP
jgi:hypothetical protein